MKIIFAIICFSLGACSSQIYRDELSPISSVHQFDEMILIGKWYEIARYPNWFERDCFSTTADYSLRKDGDIKVTNTCKKGSVNGPEKQAVGKAKLVASGKLQVTFAPFYIGKKANYWVLGLKNNNILVIGNEGGKTGWILARSAEISEPEMDWANRVLMRNGYALDKLELVLQNK